MKKYIIITLAALVSLCACTKNEVSESAKREISFSVATHVGQTKADPADYAEEYGDIPFGTCAWFYQNGQDAQYFMDHETISLNRGEKDGQAPTWKPSVTYYWPKSGSIDFISYSPRSIKEYVTVTPESISFGDEYTVEAYTDVDVMYADKAVGCTANEFNYYYNGVPTLFHHALAKLNINISTAYDSKVMEDDVDETSWAITVTDITLKDFFNTGSLDLGLADDDSWTLPTNKVWDNDGNKVDQSFDLPTDATINKDGKDFVEDYYVLPQTLTATAGQTIVITVDIVTTLPNGLKITEKGVEISGVLSEAAVKAWEMNKQISYDLIIVPAKSGSDGDPIEILFDPAVSDWEDATESGVIIKK